jgi:hypothetical protein
LPSTEARGTMGQREERKTQTTKGILLSIVTDSAEVTKVWGKTERNSEYDANEFKWNFKSNNFLGKWRHRTKDMEESDLRSEINIMSEIVMFPIWDHITGQKWNTTGKQVKKWARLFRSVAL